MELNRLRERTDLTFDWFTADISGPGTPPDYEAIQRWMGSYFERIHDASGYPIRDEDGHCIPKPVEAYRVDLSLGSLLQWSRWWNKSAGQLQTLSTSSAGIPVGWDYLRDSIRLEQLLSSPDSFLLRQHGLQALYKFETQFPEEISLPNFFWELKEIGGLIPRISSSFTKMLAGGFLNWEFGWKPFLSDLATLGSLANAVADRLEQLRKTYGKVTRLGYYAPEWWTPSIPSHTFPTTSWNGLQVEIQPTFVRSDLRVGALFFHKIPYLNDIIGTIRAFVGALGLNNPLKTVWQAMPFSFVIDWFTTFGSTLDAVAVLQDKTVDWRIWNVNWSMKTRHRFDVYQVNHPNGQEEFFRTKIGRGEAKCYHRTLGYPEAHWLATNVSLSPKQVTLLSALVLG